VLRLLGRLTVGFAALFGALASSQLPEFAQQYRQRLGGALDEMRQVVLAFEADANRNELTRTEALDRYRGSDQPFLRDQGVTAERTISRYEDLAEQEARLEAAPPLMRPVVVLSEPDSRVVRAAWSDYEPAMPVTAAGFVWAAIGFFLAGGFVSLARQIFGAVRKWRRPQPQT
jgi:hypothetical protein